MAKDLWPPWVETWGSLLVELENWNMLELDFRTESEGHPEWGKRKKNLVLQLNTKLSNEFINLKTALNIHSKSIGNKLNITHWLII